MLMTIKCLLLAQTSLLSSALVHKLPNEHSYLAILVGLKFTVSKRAHCVSANPFPILVFLNLTVAP